MYEPDGAGESPENDRKNGITPYGRCNIVISGLGGR